VGTVIAMRMRTLALASTAAILCAAARPAAGDARPAVTVDSTYPGYTADVIADGRWIEEGRETTSDLANANRLGNAGNTWVSAESPGEHWVRLDWPAEVTVGRVEIWWAVREWYPRAFRVEALRGDRWVPALGDGWYAALGRRSVIAFAPVRATALRVLQHAHGGGDRELLAVQEVIVSAGGSDALVVTGARKLGRAEFERLEPRRPEIDLARLSDRQPGASREFLLLASGERLWVDGPPVAAPADAVGLGVEWPLEHVIDGATLVCSRGLPTDVAPEVHDGRRWVPTTAGLRARREGRRLTVSFRPVATRAFAFRTTADALAGARLEVHRYLPPSANEWPDYLVNGGLDAEVLSSGEEPSLEGLAMHALSMQPARALLGLKDGQHEIGATWDGNLLWRDGVTFSFGDERTTLADYRDTVTRELIDGWRPGVVVRGRMRDLAVTETAFVSFAGQGTDKPALFVHLELCNLSSAPFATSVRAEVKGPDGARWALRRGCLVRDGQIALATLSRARLGDEPGSLEVPVDIPAGGSAAVDLVQPHDVSAPLSDAQAYREASLNSATERFRAYWGDLLRQAMTVDVPEARVNGMYRSILAQILINADGDVMYYGSEPGCYDKSLFGVEEGFCTTALAFCGLQADAQRYLDGTYLTPEFLAKIPEYTDTAYRHQQYRNGLQPHYAVLAYRFGRDRAWIEKHLGLIRECADWTAGQHQRTMASADGERPLEWGLLPKWAYGGDIGDVLCHQLYPNAACWRGMADTAWLLGNLGDRDAAAVYRAEAADYRAAIERAADGNYRPEHDPPFLPFRLYADEPTEGDYYQLFAGILLDLYPFDPLGQRTDRVMDYLERDNRMFCGLPRFRVNVGAGGLDGIYGLGYVLTKLQQDKIDEFLLGFYGYLAFNLERGTFAGRETNAIYASDVHVSASYPVPDMSDPLPSGSAVALHYLRNMLVTEEVGADGEADGNLLLLSGAPRAWFADGQRIAVRNAPTYFGKVSVEVKSAVALGRIEAVVHPPTRDPWGLIKLRLRHPDRVLMKRVTVNGREWTGFDAERDLVILPPGSEEYRVVAEYR